MHRLLSLVMVVAVIVASPLFAFQPPGVKTIRGSEHPELIPDNIVWRHVFLTLEATKAIKGEADLAWDLPLAKTDADILYAEAVRQTQRDGQCKERYMTRQRELKAQDAAPKDLARELTEVSIACRSKDLDAADRVLDALSPEGRTTLAAWVEKTRRNMTVSVPEADLGTYRLPR